MDGLCVVARISIGEAEERNVSKSLLKKHLSVCYSDRRNIENDLLLDRKRHWHAPVRATERCRGAALCSPPGPAPPAEVLQRSTLANIVLRFSGPLPVMLGSVEGPAM